MWFIYHFNTFECLHSENDGEFGNDKLSLKINS